MENTHTHTHTRTLYHDDGGVRRIFFKSCVRILAPMSKFNTNAIFNPTVIGQVIRRTTVLLPFFLSTVVRTMVMVFFFFTGSGDYIRLRGFKRPEIIIKGVFGKIRTRLNSHSKYIDRRVSSPML